MAGSGTYGFSGDGGPATSAQLNDVTGVAVDSAGELYIGDTENNRIRKVLNGVIATVAGDGACCYSGDNGPATSAELNNPAGVAVDAAGNVYIADLYNDRLRGLTPSGSSCRASVTPLAVSAPASGGSFSLAIQAGSSCAWAVQDLPDWIAFAGSAVGTGSGSAALNVSVNLNGPRAAVLSIAGAWVTVNQAGAIAAPAPVLESPANGATGVSPTPTLAWSASMGATSYDVYFGASAAPPLLMNTTNLSYSPSTLNSATTYYWAVAARNGVGAAISGVWSFTTGCASPLNPSSAAAGAGASAGSEPVTATMACGWTAVSNVPWIAIASGASGGDLAWITDEYSTMTPFNSDNSNILLVHQSYFGLYDGSGSYIRDLPLEIDSSAEPRWSRSDNHTIYYIHNNQLKTYDISSGAMGVVHTFSEYSVIGGFGESDISLDGDHFVLAGNNEFVFVYRISTDTKFRVFDAGSQPFDSLYITPGNNVIVTWYAVGTARYTGQELFDIDMNFLRQVGGADGHKALTTDANGDEVLIWTNSGDPNPIANCNNGIVKIRLADASQTCLLQLDWSLAVNISGPDNSGFVYVDTYAPGNPAPPGGWAPYTNELLQVKLDGSQALRLAHHRSRPNPANNYNWEPRISTSRDGSRVVYNSDYDLQAIDGYADQYSDVYLIVVGSSPTGLLGGGLALPPNYNTFQPPAVGGSYVDPVFGSTIRRVSNALGTPDAGDSGNGTVDYTVAANTGAQRTGTITIAGQTFTVTQAALNTLTVGSATVAPGAGFSIPSAVCSYTTQCYLVGPGGAFSIPITLALSGGVTTDALTFSIQVTPTGGAPALISPLGFTQNASIAGAPIISAGAALNQIGVAWASLSSPFSGTSTLGAVGGTIPAGAVGGQSYTVVVTEVSAATGTTSVPVSTGANGAINVAIAYMVGDVYPYTSGAPNFGDGVLNILDLIQELFAVTNVPGYQPAACSDRFDAMDTYPVDTATTRGGDGALNILDLIRELFRVTDLDTSRPVRTSLGGALPWAACTSGSSGNSISSTEVKRDSAVSPSPQTGVQGALALGRPELL